MLRLIHILYCEKKRINLQSVPEDDRICQPGSVFVVCPVLRIEFMCPTMDPYCFQI